MGPTAAIVIVGDEILAGHTQDTNSGWIANRLRERGLRLLRIETIPDDVADIEATLRRLSLLTFDWILVVGGLGPTPDDRTYEAVGRALGAPLEIDPAAVGRMRARLALKPYSKETWADPDNSTPMRRMLAIPRGARPLDNPVGAALGCVATLGPAKIAVFPGVPRELQAMFDESFAAEFLPQADPEAVVEVETVAAEASLWDILTGIESDFPTVRLGSYPQDHRGRVILRLSGRAADVDRARARLVELLEQRRSA